jgi:hypothetical protein
MIDNHSVIVMDFAMLQKSCKTAELIENNFIVANKKKRIYPPPMVQLQYSF